MPAGFGFDLTAFLSACTALLAAFVFGGLIGLERQIRQRNAGLRTMVLVAVGAAAFVHLGNRLLGAEGETRIIAYVVSGIGFLGAGVIMKEGAQVRGLNTAATLWSSAAVGAFAGSGLIAEAGAVTVFVLAGNTLLRPLVNYLNRQPISAAATEAHYRVHAVCNAENVTDARDVLSSALARANYPIREIDVLSETEDQVELAASLIPTTADPRELDAVCAEIEASDAVDSATWTVSTTL
ncbi:MgtC/SapB family protein [Labrys wisconsinensis]|uniref:Protein MgtC n=1 Tax=Labrys wisconsinensis TaxID=425677 RepID=A0ABU0JKQ7_9HYPH|nr:MgtC/SapB family protein [Labrys wisconsinensis]MDQ0474046.1 putative Mg2+ transporter-C (MgtC) family protein [Labrys wisconsinensis]